ncbi:hypothetical protein BJX63DRAFT_378513 [Aspergillus granulosus]|uniref:Uncharacterized protein n=1 Tax=Aspergillus granulosus TaxID=176169 RepID=A0ABR4I1C9_9EURO
MKSPGWVGGHASRISRMDRGKALARMPAPSRARNQAMERVGILPLSPKLSIFPSIGSTACHIWRRRE